jgi:hypothetical protein
MAQDSFSFKNIPPSPVDFLGGNIISKTIQGLGFRYYWATEGLRSEDLSYRPSDGASSLYETLEHIYGLCEVIHNSALNIASRRPLKDVPQDFNILRQETLKLIESASKSFDDKNQKELQKLRVIFDRGGKHSEFPLWNLINGPLSDALYHTGQVVSFRRTSGNPIPKGVNVFLGKKQ